MGKEGERHCLFSPLLTPKQKYSTESAWRHRQRLELLHEFNLQTGKQLTATQLRDVAVRIFGQPGQVDISNSLLEWVHKEYRRWTDPNKSVKQVSDLTKYYNGEGIGRKGRRSRRADRDDDDVEPEGADEIQLAD